MTTNNVFSQYVSSKCQQNITVIFQCMNFILFSINYKPLYGCLFIFNVYSKKVTFEYSGSN